MPNRTQDLVDVGVVESDDAYSRYVRAIIGGTPGLSNSWACDSAKTAFECLGQHVPAVILVSLFLRDRTGTDFIVQARKVWPNLSILLLLPEGQTNLFVEALEAGACAYLAKPCSADALVQAVWTVRQGGSVVANPVARAVVDYFRARGSVLARLSDRERQVLGCFTQGFSQAHVARHLGISHATVRTHVRHVLEKLGAHSTAEAIALYLNPRIPQPRESRPVPINNKWPVDRVHFSGSV